MRTKAYEDYIASNEWREVRRRFFGSKLPTHSCWGCGTKRASGFHVHHITYKRFMKEHLADLALLCGTCHSQLHEDHGGGFLQPSYTKKWCQKNHRRLKLVHSAGAHWSVVCNAGPSVALSPLEPYVPRRANGTPKKKNKQKNKTPAKLTEADLAVLQDPNRKGGMSQKVRRGERVMPPRRKQPIPPKKAKRRR